MKSILTTLLIALTLSISGEAIAQGKKAPDFKLKSATGKTFELSAQKGKVVVVNFWATWCGPCRKEIPDFIEVYNKYKSQGLEIIGISLDQNGWEAVNPFVASNKINYPIVLGDDNVVAAYGDINAIPTTFIIDQKGTIVDHQVGTMSKAQLESKIQPLLKKKGV